MHGAQYPQLSQQHFCPQIPESSMLPKLISFTHTVMYCNAMVDVLQVNRKS
ncbi:uncharacterized protein PHALS_00770 [Plasmopara halstedii]|uniref:Uncharacterized protein n=1 Tax=Plasmopara halstedii TaxID=4781 RepID=A0A0P1ASW5_PLAHL|nr:uncharacterized protein PHALS_00770 [Plasmopara halstedii]CEG44402.1 hypothetical protein PHALS_00770 [Plasmopara halstedii]|eukprot:XP_024580771.1 hypothetical protein PHALS_00770 [Plasmopara halstedii]